MKKEIKKYMEGKRGTLSIERKKTEVKNEIEKGNKKEKKKRENGRKYNKEKSRERREIKNAFWGYNLNSRSLDNDVKLLYYCRDSRKTNIIKVE